MSNTARKLDGIYLQIKTVLSKPENKRRITWGTVGIIFGAIFILVFLNWSAILQTMAKEEAGSAEEIIGEIPVTKPDFVQDKILSVHASSGESVIVHIDKPSQKQELWLYNLETLEQKGIYLGKVASASHIGLKEGFIFWFSQERQALFALDSYKNFYYKKVVFPFDAAKGKRATIQFSLTPWKIIVTADSLYFFSPQTGEVFSDGNSEAIDSFRQKFNLDSILTKEELSNLGFSVKEVEEEGYE